MLILLYIFEEAEKVLISYLDLFYDLKKNRTVLYNKNIIYNI